MIDVSSYDDLDVLIGKRVKIVDNSKYQDQAYRKNGNGEGKIIRICDFPISYDIEKNYSFSVKWDNGE